MAIQSRFCTNWESFRNHLTNKQKSNLSALINAELLNGTLAEGRQRVIIVTPSPRISVWTLVHGSILYILGGHWLRDDQPTADWLKLIRRDIQRAKKGTLQ